MIRDYCRLVAEAAGDGMSGLVTLISCSWEISELWACCPDSCWPLKDRLVLLCVFVWYPDFLHGCLKGDLLGEMETWKEKPKKWTTLSIPTRSCHLAGEQK